MESFDAMPDTVVDGNTVKSTFQNTTEIGKPEILKNEKKKVITLILLALQEGPLV